MKIVLLCNKSKPELQQVFDTIAAFGHDITISDAKPSIEFLSEFDIGVSWMYRHILKQEQIDAVRLGIINNHIGYLEHGRGADPAVWAIANDEPAGVTMHWIDAGVDTGPIIAQRQVIKTSIDTWEDLYVRLTAEMLSLFSDTWPVLESLNFKMLGRAQDANFTTRMSMAVKSLDDLEHKFGKAVARGVVNTLRARTFPGKPSAYIRDSDGKKIYVRVALEKEA